MCPVTSRYCLWHVSYLLAFVHHSDFVFTLSNTLCPRQFKALPKVISLLISECRTCLISKSGIFSPNTSCLPTQFIRIDEFLYPQHELIHFVQEETEVQGEVNHSVTLMELAMNVWPRENMKLREG